MSQLAELAELTTITQKRFQCRHVHAAGRQCGSPALRNQQFCYFHHTTRVPQKTGGFRYLDATEPFELPLVEDRASALSAAAQILCRIASNDLDLGRAGKLLYNLQILNALLPREERAAPESRPAPSPRPPVEDRVLVEELVLDETHGPIAPITELPPPAEAPGAPCSTQSTMGLHSTGTAAHASKPPNRVYTEEETDFLKSTTCATSYDPAHRPRPESITDDDIIAAINALRRRRRLGPIENEPNWNRATLSADPVHPPASRCPEASASTPAPTYPEASAKALVYQKQPCCT